VALRVDRALELALIDEGAVEAAEAVLPGVEYVAQVAHFPDGLVLIHDLRTFLSAAEADALAEALSRSTSHSGEGTAS
jgi:purine-binding chemotaxis protein CheW